MEYKLPDIRDEGAYIRSLHPDRIAKAKNDIQAHLDAVLNIMQDALDNQEEHVCGICEDFGYGYRGIPDDWAYMNNMVVCNNCLGRWFERFGELPELSKEIEI